MAINLGDINFGLGPDTSRLTAAMDQVTRFGLIVNGVAASQADGAKAATAQLLRQEAATVNALQATIKLNDAIRKAGADAALIGQASSAFDTLVAGMTAGANSTLEQQRALEQFRASLANVKRDLATFQNQQQQTVATQNGATTASAANERQLLRQDAAFFQASQAVLNFQQRLKSVASEEVVAGLTSDAAASLQQLSTAFLKGALSAKEFQAAMISFKSEMNSLNRTVLDLSAHEKLGGLPALMKEAGAAMILINGPLGGFAARMTVLSSLLTRTSLATVGFVGGLAAAAFAVAKIGGAAIDSAKQMQQLTLAFDAITGDHNTTTFELNEIHDIAMRLGGSFTDLAHDYEQFSAAAKTTNLRGQDTMDVFNQVSSAGAKLGLNTSQMTGIFNALQQMLSKGKVEAQELRQQLGNDLPGAFAIAAKAMGVTTAQLEKLVSTGKVDAVDFLKKFGVTLDQVLGVDLTKNIDTLTAKQGRLTTSLFDFGLAADKAVGFSSAYGKSIDFLAGILESASKNFFDIIPIVGALTGALVAGLFGPTVINGALALAVAISQMAKWMAAFDIATLENPIGDIAQVLVRAGSAALGAFAGFELLQGIISGTAVTIDTQGQSSINAYIGAQDNLKISIHSVTAEYIKQQEVIAQVAQTAAEAAAKQVLSAELTLSSLQGQMDDLKATQPKGGPPDPSMGFAPNSMSEIQARIDSARAKLTEFQKIAGPASAAASDAVAGLDKLHAILAKPEAGGNTDLADKLDQAAKAGREAGQSIDDLGLQYKLLFEVGHQKAWDTMQDDINKKVQDFHDKLQDAGVVVSEQTRLTDQYRKALTLLEEQQLKMQETETLFTLLSEKLSAGFDNMASSFVDAVLSGKDALKSLDDAAKQVVNDILKTLLQLTVSNPLKNLLFGMNSPTLGFSGGPSGGILGSVIGMIGSALHFHQGGIVGSGGQSIPRYHSGGMIGNLLGLRSDEQLGILQNGERVIPRGGNGTGGGSAPQTVINVINQTGQQVDVQHGDTSFDGEKYVQQVLIKLFGNGNLDNVMQRFNMKPGVMRRPFTGRVS